MKHLPLTLPTPGENLACDEALLDACEEGRTGAVLRFFESPEVMVVVGYGNQVDREVDLPACAAARVPVLRRVSGGGTVVLGPGCLGYAVILPLAWAPELETVSGTNRFVMERHRAAISTLLGRPVEIQGHTDLTVDGRKFSGNSQRRRRGAVLFHGTFLAGMDLAPISRLLRMPSHQPEYRQARHHGDFVTNLPVPPDALRQSLLLAWGARERLEWTPALAAAVSGLVAVRYGSEEWHRRR